jgi:hypothetical protein
MIDGKTPAKAPLCAAEFVSLAGIEDRHPKAVSYELARASAETLIQLAYGEHAEPVFLGDTPDWLASAAYDEIERRQGAVARLLADCPALRMEA